MKTIVFIGANKSGSSYEAIKASEELHYYTVLLTDRKSFFDKRLDFPHVHSMRMCDLDNIDELKSAIACIDSDRFTVEAIVSFIDPYCHTAARLSRAFGLKAFTAEAIETMLDKTKSRAALRDTPYAPPYQVIDSEAEDTARALDLPVVLKAPVSSASRDVLVAATDRAYQDAFGALRRRSPDGPVLVEQYLPGPQVLVETLTVDGVVHIAAVVRQEILFAGRFIVTGYQIVTDENSAFFRGLRDAAQSIVLAHGLRDGPCHLELRRSGGAWKLIEANPRISGGAMNLLIETAYGVNLAKETLKAATGRRPELGQRRRQEAFLQYVVVPEAGRLIKVTGRTMAQNSPGVRWVYVKPKKGSLLTPPASMGHRYAYVIATGGTAAEARRRAKAGAGCIQFHLRKTGGSQVPVERIREVAGDHAEVGIGDFAGSVVWES